jgi:phosphoribosyl-AMP cyclohydrolase / phosphoribosyl-ATP pyrophosphohydrolase
VQRLVGLYGDCDGDAIVALVVPAGPSCHTGEWTCFGAAPVLPALDAVVAERARASDSGAAASGSYTQRLLSDPNLRLKKLGEEAVELALACERGEAERAAEEAADLLYHALVACRAVGTTLADVLATLAQRRGLSAAAVAPAGDDRTSAG